MRAIASAFAVALFAVSASGSPSSVGVFFDADATDCDASAAAFMPFTVWLCATLGTDAAGNGILGVQFRVAGLSDIVWSITPSAAAQFALGDPTANGCVIGFPTCTSGVGPQNAVLLYTILCLPFGPVSPRVLSVEPPTLPCNDCWTPGPVATLCDAPVFTKLSVSGGQAMLNNGSCTVTVRPATWGGVKSLFRG